MLVLSFHISIQGALGVVLWVSHAHTPQQYQLQVCHFQTDNGMDAERLSRLFSPLILRPRQYSPDESKLASANQIVLFMVQNIQTIAEVHVRAMRNMAALAQGLHAEQCVGDVHVVD